MNNIQKNSHNIVYSTNRNFDAEEIDSSPDKKNENQIIYLHLERKGGGKIVTLIKGYSHDSSKLLSLAKKIKKLCGAGGSVKTDYIIIQGNNREKIFQYLLQQGHKVKKSGA